MERGSGEEEYKSSKELSSSSPTTENKNIKNKKSVSRSDDNLKVNNDVLENSSEVCSTV